MKTGFLMLAAILATVTPPGNLLAQIGPAPAPHTTTASTVTNDKYDFISINSVLMHFSNNGSLGHNPATDGAGFEWPKGSGKTMIFQDGLVHGGLVQGEVRVGGSTYRYGWQAGAIDSIGLARDPADPGNRIYRMRRVGRTAFDALPAPEQQRLRADFNEWPVRDGMPFLDANANGRYDPDFDAWLDDSAAADKPWFIGDEFFCFFANDLNFARTSNLYGTDPIGLEIRTMIWAYDRPGPLQNTVFVKHVIVNKGKKAYDNVYFARWADPDLGDANDDFVGVDTARNMALVYNGRARDNMYGQPPALGIRMLQGPVESDPGGTALFGFDTRAGLSNMPINSFSFYINSDNVYVDPDLGVPKGSTQMYNYLRSLLYSGAPFTDPITKTRTPFCLAGDPVSQTGWNDGLVHSAGDRRLMMGAGPVTMLQGDTQEVAYAWIATQQTTVARSISSVRDMSDLVHLFYRHLDLGDIMPELVSTVSYPTPDSARVFVRATLPLALSATGTTTRKDGSIAGQFALYDDGMHDDGAPGDQMFAGTWISPRSVSGVNCTVTATYTGSVTYTWPAGRCLPLAGTATASLHAVESDHLNFDHVANPGENVLVSVEVRNTTPLPLGPWRVSNDGFDDGIPVSVAIDSVLAPSATAWRPYAVADTKSYLSMNIPASAGDAEVFRMPVVIEETNNNCWCDTMLVMAHSFATPVADSLTMHTAGPATGTFGWRVVQSDSLVDHAYRITVQGSEYDSLHHVRIADLTIPRIVAADLPLPTVYAHEGAVTGGWKLTRGNVVENWLDSTDDSWMGDTPMLHVQYLPASHLWYRETMPFDAGLLFFGSALGRLDLLPVKLVFDTQHPQRAYQFLRGGTPNYGCTGYFDIPVRAFDMSNPGAPRQISLAFVEQKGGAQQNNTWDPKSTTDREYLFVLNSDYAANPDPAMLAYKINADAVSMPILYAGWIIPDTPNSAFIDGDSLLFTPVIPVTQRDTFIIHPFAPRAALSLPGVPALVAPHDTATGIPLTASLQWSPAAGAEFYTVQIASNAGFTAKVRTLHGIAGTETAVPNLALYAKYFWRVSAFNAAGDGAWSEVRSFTTGTQFHAPPPVTLEPQNGSFGTDTLPTFRWGSVPEATAYQLQVSDAQFREPYDLDVIVFDTVYHSTRRLRSNSTAWRVRVMHESNQGTWSPLRTFSSTAAVPALLFPADGTGLHGPDTVLQWVPATGAAAYRLQVDTSASFGTSFDTVGVTGTSAYVRNLEHDKRYFWRVSSLNFAGQSDWSPVWTFFSEIFVAVDNSQSPGIGFELDVSPQPARDFVTVELRSLDGNSVSVTLNDALGRSVEERTLHAAETLTLRFSVASLPPGLYVVRAVCGKETRTRRVIVSR
ncbi:MAG: T9SS type A sorting domain-containing protein [Ignavibacteria bacterium]|nr:T9SS type A sorting domain-containing protein [Ignavibacteria bacterium]